VEENFEDPRLKAAVKRVWSGESAPAALKQRLQDLALQNLAPQNGQDGSPEISPEISRGGSPQIPPQNTPHNPMRISPAGELSAGAVLAGALSAPASTDAGSFKPAPKELDPAFRPNPFRNSPNRFAPNPRGWIGALAALVLISGGLFAWHLMGPHDAALPDDVAINMVKTHDFCSAAPDHHLIRGVGPDDFVAIGQKLAADLKVPILSTPVDNWQFAGAGRCMVWGHESGHLLYRNGAETLSVFTLPAKDFGLSAASENYDATVNGHHIAGFVNAGGLYCVVMYAPDGSVNESQAMALRDHLRDAFDKDTVAVDDPRPISIKAANALASEFEQ
jgi:hypothetical protein